jgi:hypothetical protein
MFLYNQDKGKEYECKFVHFSTKADDIVRVTLHGTIVQLTTRKLTVAGSSTVDAAGRPEKVEG